MIANIKAMALGGNYPGAFCYIWCLTSAAAIDVELLYTR